MNWRQKLFEIKLKIGVDNRELICYNISVTKERTGNEMVTIKEIGALKIMTV